MHNPPTSECERVKLTFQETTEENIVPVESESAKGPLEEISLTRRLTCGARNRIEMTQTPKKAKVPKDRIEPAKATTSPPADSEERR